MRRIATFCRTLTLLCRLKKQRKVIVALGAFGKLSGRYFRGSRVTWECPAIVDSVWRRFPEETSSFGACWRCLETAFCLAARQQ